MVGNPPWVKVEWQEGGILGDYNPMLELRKLWRVSWLQKEKFVCYLSRFASGLSTRI